MPTIYEDIIHLRNLRLSAVIGFDAWNRPNQSQPIILSLQLYLDRTPAGNSDDIKDTFSYGQMCKEVIKKVDGKSFEGIDQLALSVGGLFNDWPGNMLKLQVSAPKSILRVEGGLTKECIWQQEDSNRWGSHAWAIEGLKIPCIIGVNPHERLQKQVVNVNLHITGAIEDATYRQQVIEGNRAWGPLVRRICEVSRVPEHTEFGVMQLVPFYLFLPFHLQVVEPSSYETLEALSTRIAKTALEEFPILQIGVRVEKPSALIFVEGAGVEIFRDQQWLATLISK